ncbi:cystathionine beta-lyase [Streptomyces griseocarneus]|nr:cystathionine beta-lyase [Streptomyces griseocarneus]
MPAEDSISAEGPVPTAENNPLCRYSLDELRLRTSSKWTAYPPDVLPLWIAEMDVPVAEPVVRAVTEAMERGDTGYADGREYARALDVFARERWGWDGVVAERSAIVPDVMHGAVEILKLITRPGDAVVVNPPVYPPFYAFVEHMDRRIVEAPLDRAGRIDLDVLETACREAVAGGRRAAYLLCSPHNPAGTVHTAQELAAVADVTNRHGVRVVVDEVHGPLVLPGSRFVPYLSVPGAEGAFSLMSASKGWHLAGFKAALAVAGPAAAADLARMPGEVSHGPSHLGVLAHTAALLHGGAWLDTVLAALDENRRLLGDLLSRHLPEVRYAPPQATYLAWLDCRALGLGEDPSAAFLERGRVAVNSGTAFGTGGTGHVRLNFATSPEILAEGVERMRKALA